MIRALALAVVFASLSAAETLGVDFSALDHQAHALGGAAIAATVTASVNSLWPDAPRFAKGAASVLIPTLVSLAYETRKMRVRGDAFDGGDFLAATYGGVAASISLSWTW